MPFSQQRRWLGVHAAIKEEKKNVLQGGGRMFTGGDTTVGHGRPRIAICVICQLVG